MVTNRIAFPFARTGRIMLVVAFSAAAAASAEAGEVTAEQRAACTPDAVRLCSSEIPDVARVTACMKAKQASLSARCRAAFASASENESVRVSKVLPAQHQRILPAHYQRVASSAVLPYANHHRRLLPQHRWARSDRAMRIAQQVMAGFAMACGSQAVPAEVCSNMSGNFLQSGLLSSSLQSGLLSSGLLSSGLLTSMAP